MNFLRLVGLTAFLPLVLGLLTGCGFKDIDKRFFVLTAGVDKPDSSDKLFKVSLKLAIPSSAERFGANKALIVTEEANSITEAVRLMKSKVDKELDFAQCKSILFGEGLIKQKKSLSEISDWFARRRDIQMIAWVGIGRPTALDIMKANPPSERLPSNMLFMLFGRTGTETAYITSEYLFDLRRRMSERGIDPILPIIEKREADQLTVNQTALFDKQYYVTSLPPSEAKLLNSFDEGISKTEFRATDEELGLYFLISADKFKKSFSIDLSDPEQPVAHIRTVIWGTIEESKTPLKLEDLDLYEKVAEHDIKERQMVLLKKLQKADIDPIGFGLAYRAVKRTDDNEWEHWKTLYPKLKFDLNIKMNLRGTGTIK